MDVRQGRVMTSISRPPITKCLPGCVAALLMAVLAAGPCAAGAAPSTTSLPPEVGAIWPPVEEELQELDEIIATGERLARRIADAEDEFFKLYNTLNTDEDFRMDCGTRALHSGSLIQVRVCVPGFVVNYLAPSLGNGARCVEEYISLDGRRFPRGPCLDAGYATPSMSTIMMVHGDDMFRHMMAAIRSDSRLQSMAGNLDELHFQLRLMQERYGGIEDANRARGDRPARSSRGPRAR
jgi:hypothetical protein